MRRWFVLALVLLAALGLAGYASPSQTAVPGIAYFRQQTVSHAFSGRYPAATEAWREAVLLLHKQSTVGSGGIACITVSYPTRECFGTYILPLGKINVQGQIISRLNYQMSIVGGTGFYIGARGVANFTDSRATFYLTG